MLENRHVGTREIVKALNISYGSAWHIVFDVFDINYVAITLISKFLSQRQCLILTEFLIKHE